MKDHFAKGGNHPLQVHPQACPFALGPGSILSGTALSHPRSVKPKWRVMVVWCEKSTLLSWMDIYITRWGHFRPGRCFITQIHFLNHPARKSCLRLVVQLRPLCSARSSDSGPISPQQDLNIARRAVVMYCNIWCCCLVLIRQSAYSLHRCDLQISFRGSLQAEDEVDTAAAA